MRACLVALLLGGLAAPSLALDPAKAITQYGHDVWQTKDGLPQNTIAAIAQTPDGYLWLGTREGLARFDGVRFTIFDTRTTPELGHNQIVCLLADREGRLWIGTLGGGLVRMVHGEFTRFAAADGLPSGLVSAIFEDAHGTLWVGTDGAGLARQSGNRFVAEPSRDALGARIRAIVEDPDGLWVASEAGLAQLRRDGTRRSYGPAQGMSRQSVRALLRDRAGVLWAGTDLGLDRLADGRFHNFTKADGLSNDVIVALSEDRDGNLWIGTDGGGLDRYRSGVFTTYASAQGLTNDSVMSIQEDREGSVWVGTNLGGLNRLKDVRVTPFGVSEGLSNNYARAVYEDRAGDLWVGTEGGGVNRLHDGRVTALTTKNGLPNDTVFAILDDRQGRLWIGTDSGLARITNGRIEVFHAVNGLSNDSVLALAESRDGSIWIGTYAGGLSRYKDGTFTTFTTKDGLGADTINVILEDHAGTLWIGTRGGGLTRYADDRFTSFTKKDGLSDDLVFALHEDAEGSLWIGTYGGGLNRLKNGRFAAITERQGLFNNVVHHIVEDGAGRVWMSSNKGIFSVAKSELDAIADGANARVNSVAYGVADGMRNVECNGGSAAGARTRDGRIWFPTIDGAVSIDPAHLITNRLPPPVLIEEVLVDGAAVSTAGGVRLPPNAQTLAVNFTALTFVAPAAVRFRYQLEGLETDWVQAESRRTAYYSKLPAGHYRFHVIAANNDGVWNDSGAALEFSVAPRYFETWWFRGAVLLIALSAAPVFYRYRIRRLTRQTLRLERLVDERTAALAEANARLAQAAQEDGLTGLLNRRALDLALDEECRRANRLRTPLSLLLLDIDGFKSFNDEYGHQAGDACLRDVAGAVAAAHRRAGELVARYGGEELVVILPGVGREAAHQRAEHVRARVLELAIPHAHSAVAPVVTVSIGVACTDPGVDATPATLIADADRALYRAKELGRNRVEMSGH